MHGTTIPSVRKRGATPERREPQPEAIEFARPGNLLIGTPNCMKTTVEIRTANLGHGVTTRTFLTSGMKIQLHTYWGKENGNYASQIVVSSKMFPVA